MTMTTTARRISLSLLTLIIGFSMLVMNPRSARAMSITGLTFFPADTWYQVVINTNWSAASNPGGYVLYTCAMAKSICDAHLPATWATTTPYSTDPNYWTNATLRSTASVGLTQTNLRQNRTYSVTFVTVGVNDSSVSEMGGSTTTWPGPQIKPTASNVTANSATVSWTSGFPSPSKIEVSLSPPDWGRDYSIGATDTYSDIYAESSGRAWAVSYNGWLTQRTSNVGSWSTYGTQFSTTHLRSIDFGSSSFGIMVGDFGFAAKTTNAGALWQQFLYPGSVTSLPGDSGLALFGVSAPSSNSAWVVGQNQSIYKFDGTKLVSQYTGTVGESFVSVATVDGRTIVAVGTSNQFIRSTDGGITWTAGFLCGGSGCGIGQVAHSVTTSDGNTFWAGSSGGKLWKSTDAGQTWLGSSIGSGATITKVVAVSPTELWVVTGTAIFQSIDGGANFLPTGASSLPGAVTNVASLAVGTNADLVAVGDNALATYGLCHVSTGCGFVTPVTDMNVTTNHVMNLSVGPSGAWIYFAARSQDDLSNPAYASAALGSFKLLQPDSIPPVISITTPTAPPGPAYTNVTPTTIGGTTQDNVGVTNILVKRNGSSVASGVFSPNPTVANTDTPWTSSVPLLIGSNSIVATASDQAPNTTDTPALTVILDQTKPTISIDPVGSPVFNAILPLTGKASDDVALDHLTVSVNGTSPTTIKTYASPPGPGVQDPWSTSVTLTLGNNSIVARAYDKAGNFLDSNTVTVQYSAPSITLQNDTTTHAANQTINAGQSATFDYKLISSGYTGGVTLAVTGAPGSVILTPGAQQNVTAGSTTAQKIDIQTTAATAAQLYTIVLTGTGAGVNPTSATVTLQVNAAPNITISATPSPLNVVAGTSGTYQLKVSANSTFSGTVTFSISGLPAATTGTFSTPSISLTPNQVNNSVTLVADTAPTTPPGSYTLTITGDSAALAAPATATVILNVSAAPDIDMSFLPPSQTVTAGGAGASYNGTITAKNGYTGTLALSVTSLQPNPDLTLDIPPTLTLSNALPVNVVLNATAGHASPGGSYTLEVSADDASVSPPIHKKATVTLVVNPDITPPVISNILAIPSYSLPDLAAQVRITWDTDEPANSAIAIYADAALTGPPVGVVSDPTYCTISTASCHNLLYKPLATLTTYYFTVTSTDQAATPLTTTVSKDGAGQPLQFTTPDTPDLVPPTITLTAPTSGADVFGTTNIVGTATDNKNLAVVKITVTNQSTGQVTTLTNITCSGTTYNFNFPWNTLGVVNGTYVITATATDTGPNDSAPATVTVNVNNDTSDPQILTGPKAVGLDCAATCRITIIWTTDDLSTSEVSYQEESAFLAAHSCDASGRCKYQLNQSDPTLTTDHSVTLTGLEPSKIYHYAIASCNVSGYCFQGFTK